MSGSDDEFAARLATELSAVLDGRPVSGLVRLSGGASRETWRFRADGRDLVVQRQRPGETRDMAVEAAVLRAVAAAGGPVPEVLADGPDLLGGAFIVSTAVDGETIARKILRDDDFAEARPILAGQLGEALARIHAVDAASIEGLEHVDPLATYREALDTIGEPHPAFELVFRWLEEHRPPAGPVSLVHGDFRLGNVVVGGDGLTAVLDWELAHLGDPMEDLGWLCVRAWRFGAEQPVAGVGEYDQLFDAYEAAGGGVVDRATAYWWEVLGTLKWGVICVMQADVHRSGRVRSHELAAIGRRVCENEYDLFRALEGRW